jgi:hypothetical protein
MSKAPLGIWISSDCFSYLVTPVPAFVTGEALMMKQHMIGVKQGGV